MCLFLDFSLEQWSRERGQTHRSVLPDYYTSELLQQLDLTSYLQSPMCTKKTGSNGWVKGNVISWSSFFFIKSFWIDICLLWTVRKIHDHQNIFVLSLFNIKNVLLNWKQCFKWKKLTSLTHLNQAYYDLKYCNNIDY